MRALVLAALALTGCGRLRFDDLGGARDDAAPARCDVRSVAAGHRFTCVLDGAGAAWCWGLNDTGQIAVGGPRNVLAAMQIGLPAPAVELAAGRQFACARLADDSVWCWGDNRRGQLGGATAGPVSGPVAVPLGSDGTLGIHAGAHHACVRRRSDQAIACWGSNDYLVLGNDVAADLPPSVIAGTAGSRQLAIGHRHACAVDATERAVCWGRGESGQLGDGTTVGERATPVEVAITAPVRRVAAAGRYACAVEEGGDVRCWGSNFDGQLGDGSFIGTSAPGAITDRGVLEVQLTGGQGCALRSGGEVACWGGPSPGGGAAAMPEPIGVTGATALAGGYFHLCAVTGAGLVCWGFNGDGELGTGVRSVSAEPVPIALPAAAGSIAVAGDTACARIGDDVYCWGGNDSGELGNGGGASSPVPVRVAVGLPTVEGVSGHQNHFCAWGNGAVACWGRNDQGQLGDGLRQRSSPPAISNLAGVTSIAPGAGHTCAIAGSSVWCWGENNFGQLGDGTTARSLFPLEVPGLTSATAVDAAGGYSCAVSGGAAWCWGRNSFGQLGDGTTSRRAMPVSPAIPGTVVHIKTRQNYTCASTTTGAVFCWGRNNLGQLGDGTRIDRLVPTLVALPGAAIDLAASGTGTCARLATGAVACWGQGAYGELGNGSFEDADTPVEVPALAGATAIALGAGGGCAIRADQLVCWGPELLRATGTLSGGPMPIALTCSP